MIERGDFLVVHEPFSNLAALGHFVVGTTRVSSFGELVGLLRDQAAVKPVFFKDTTEYRYPEVLEDPTLLNEAVHTFIIRDPAEVIASHYAINPRLTLAEVGYGHLLEIFDAVRRRSGTTPVVMDAADLVADPEGMVRAYCSQVGIPFLPEALRWEHGERGEWARTTHWHEDVNRSTGMNDASRQYPVRVDNNDLLAALYQHHLPFYAELRTHRLTPLADRPG